MDYIANLIKGSSQGESPKNVVHQLQTKTIENQKQNKNYKIFKNYKNIKQCIYPLCFMKIRVLLENFLAMIDTGSEVNVVGSELLEKMYFEDWMTSRIELKGCGGTDESSRWVRIPVELPTKQTLWIPAVVSKQFGTALILGSPFLKDIKASINYEKNVIETAEGEIPLVNLPEGLPSSNRRKV